MNADCALRRACQQLEGRWASWVAGRRADFRLTALLNRQITAELKVEKKSYASNYKEGRPKYESNN
jgi:hypothetical protein